MRDDAYYRPIAQTDAVRPKASLPLAGGSSWFSQAERIERGGRSERVPLAEVPADLLEKITAPRAPIGGLSLDRPRLMAILNVTPDSFSDGGRFDDFSAALAQAEQMLRDGADILDIGGESTRPGADYVEPALEIARTAPVIAALQASAPAARVSIDTRKAAVATAALEAGAAMVNDVSALNFDPAMAGMIAARGVPVCLMHAKGQPKTMQQDPRYDDVLLDVYDDLAQRIDHAVASGIDRAAIIVDPGIGFGKTEAHNLKLIRGLSLFHGLGCGILLGVSRKRFIGTIGAEPAADRRAPGSIALALAAVQQGVQMLRVHDTKETRQALNLWLAAHQA